MDVRTDRFLPVFYRTPSPPVPSGAAAQKAQEQVFDNATNEDLASEVKTDVVLDGVEAFLLLLLAIKDHLDEQSSGVALHLQHNDSQGMLTNVLQLGQFAGTEHNLEGNREGDEMIYRVFLKKVLHKLEE